MFLIFNISSSDSSEEFFYAKKYFIEEKHMAEKISEEIMEAIGMVEGKGDPNVIAGTTESGKSTVIEAIAKSEAVQELLSIREASGKGSTSEVSIVATDYEKIPEDKLIMTAKLCPKTIADCGDDNDLLGNVVYSAAKDYHKNPNNDFYKKKLEKTLANATEHPANDSLAYKIKGMKKEDFNTIINIMMKFSIDEIMIIFNEMLARNPKKGQKGVRIFIELLSERPSFAKVIQEFWNFVVALINYDINDLQKELENTGAMLEKFQDGTSKFTIALGIEDKESQIVRTLLHSEDGSKEYLLSSISLIFRGADYLFDIKNLNLLTVSVLEGTEIHCVRFIDTQGLFHVTGVKTKDESERIIDILSEYHSNKLILVVSSFVTNTVKDGYEAIRIMLQEANRDIEVYVLYTHWDEYLKSYSRQNSTTGRFTRGGIKVDWKEKYKEAVKDQNDLSEMFKNSLSSNNSRKKPNIIGFYRAAILSDPESKMENELEDNGIEYPSALHRLIEDILSIEAKRGLKYKVIEGIENCFTIETSKLGNQNVAALYDNMIGECKRLKLYASTVRDCNRKWCGSGTVHKSNVAVNDNGFENITTSFVQEIRNYAMSYVSKLVIDVTPYISNQAEVARLTEEIKLYLSVNQNVGREVAKLIGTEAYNQGFVRSSGFKYQYKRFWDMIEYVQNKYFMAKNIPFTVTFEVCFFNAIKDCIRNFVDAKCIVVY